MLSPRVPLLIVGVAALTACTNVGGSGKTQPDWSPDGKKLAYVRYEIGDSCRSSIWVRDADGDNDGKLIEDGEHPDWSPDGRRIAFTWVEYGGLDVVRGGIAVMNADGSGVRRLVLRRHIGSVLSCISGSVNDPAWSPDGRLIAFSDKRGTLVMQADGTNLRRVSTSREHFPEWSPSGTQLVFFRADPGKTFDDRLQFGVMRAADGTGRRIVLATDGGGFSEGENQGLRPLWSASGMEITYVWYGGVVTRSLQTGAETSPVDCSGDCWFPTLSGDGRLLAYARGDLAGDQKIEIVELKKGQTP